MKKKEEKKEVKEEKKETKEEVKEEKKVEEKKVEEVKPQPKKTSGGDIARYVFAGLFGLGALSNLTQGNWYGIVEALFALSLCPFVYKNLLSNYIKEEGTLKTLQIIIPVVLFFVFVYASSPKKVEVDIKVPETKEEEKVPEDKPVPTPSEDTPTEEKPAEETPAEETPVEPQPEPVPEPTPEPEPVQPDEPVKPAEPTEDPAIKDGIKKALESSIDDVDDGWFTTYQTVSSIKLNTKTNKYDVVIKDTKDALTNYQCAVDFKKLLGGKSVAGNKNIGRVEMQCYKKTSVIYYLAVKDASSLKANTIEKNLVFYNNKKKVVKTSIAALKKQLVVDYKNSCRKFNYKKTLRYPEKYQGKKAYWFGKVLQVVKGGWFSDDAYRIGVNCHKYAYIGGYYCDDTIYVEYDGSTRMLEDDMVKLWGTMEGTEVYTTVLGAKVEIPKFKAKYVTITKK